MQFSVFTSTHFKKKITYNGHIKFFICIQICSFIIPWISNTVNYVYMLQVQQIMTLSSVIFQIITYAIKMCKIFSVDFTPERFLYLYCEFMNVSLNGNCLKCFQQIANLKSVSAVWSLIWIVKLLDCVNSFEQILHLKGFSPVWTLKCVFKLQDSLNLLEQISHLKAFSPVWTLKCFPKPSDRVNCDLSYESLNWPTV